MICKKCQEDFGKSYIYLIQAVEEWNPKNLKATKQKLLATLK